MTRALKLWFVVLLVLNLLFMVFHEYYEQEMVEYLQKKHLSHRTNKP